MIRMKKLLFSYIAVLMFVTLTVRGVDPESPRSGQKRKNTDESIETVQNTLAALKMKLEQLLKTVTSLHHVNTQKSYTGPQRSIKWNRNWCWLESALHSLAELKPFVQMLNNLKKEKAFKKRENGESSFDEELCRVLTALQSPHNYKDTFIEPIIMNDDRIDLKRLYNALINEKVMGSTFVQGAYNDGALAYKNITQHFIPLQLRSTYFNGVDPTPWNWAKKIMISIKGSLLDKDDNRYGLIIMPVSANHFDSKKFENNACLFNDYFTLEMGYDNMYSPAKFKMPEFIKDLPTVDGGHATYKAFSLIFGLHNAHFHNITQSDDGNWYLYDDISSQYGMKIDLPSIKSIFDTGYHGGLFIKAILYKKKGKATSDTMLTTSSSFGQKRHHHDESIEAPQKLYRGPQRSIKWAKNWCWLEAVLHSLVGLKPLMQILHDLKQENAFKYEESNNLSSFDRELYRVLMALQCPGHINQFIKPIIRDDDRIDLNRLYSAIIDEKFMGKDFHSGEFACGVHGYKQIIYFLKVKIESLTKINPSKWNNEWHQKLSISMKDDEKHDDKNRYNSSVTELWDNQFIGDIVDKKTFLTRSSLFNNYVAISMNYENPNEPSNFTMPHIIEELPMTNGKNATYKAFSVILARPNYHIINVTQSEDGNWYLYDDFNNQGGTLVTINDIHLMFKTGYFRNYFPIKLVLYKKR